MISIREEIRAIEDGSSSREDNPLIHAPHTARSVSQDAWEHSYSRETAAWPASAEHKYWPPVRRVDDAYGDRNLVCSCPPWGDEDEAK